MTQIPVDPAAAAQAPGVPESSRHAARGVWSAVERGMLVEFAQVLAIVDVFRRSYPSDRERSGWHINLHPFSHGLPRLKSLHYT